MHAVWAKTPRERCGQLARAVALALALATPACRAADDKPGDDAQALVASDAADVAAADRLDIASDPAADVAPTAEDAADEAQGSDGSPAPHDSTEIAAEVGKSCACHDDNPCTDDGCDAAENCLFTANTLACNDGNTCTFGDFCAASACQSGDLATCDDNNVCTTDTCDPLAGCLFLANTATCSDDDACTLGDACTASVCQSGSAVVCDDGNGCTSDSCDAKVGCIFAANTATCTDNDACTVGDVCAAAKCVGGKVLPCDDGNACTNDACASATGCTSLPNAATCSDADACTADDTCKGGACAAGGKTCGKIAVIGDYGLPGEAEADVAALVKSWQPDYVITMGDNYYWKSPVSASIDESIGQYYCSFIFPYKGNFGPGASTNRFFPVMGNHDWAAPDSKPYLDYFTLPGNERYFDFTLLGLHFYYVDSDPAEPDGVTPESKQGQWLKGQLANCLSQHCIVAFHHPAYTSSNSGLTPSMRWPFVPWGATSIWSGHAHVYERFEIEGIPWFVQGIGGASTHPFSATLAGSQMRFSANYGATLLEVQGDWLKQTTVTRTGVVVDQSVLPAKNSPGKSPASATLVPKGAIWHYRDNGQDPGDDWRQKTYDDKTWKQGAAPFGYGNKDAKTLVGFGADPNKKFVTTWFRRTVEVENANQFAELDLALLRDDAAAVYLNGVELWRSNLPEGPLSASTLAVADVTGNGEGCWYHKTVNSKALVAGTNVLAVEVHRYAASGVELALNFELVAKPAFGQKLIAFASAWQYRDNGVDPGASWTSIDYDDSKWSSNVAPLGYGGIGEVTPIDFGPNPFKKHPTTWLRRAFEVPDATKVKALLLRLRRDDGCIVWLNGKEVLRLNLPVGAVTATTLAGYPVTPDAQDDVVTTLLPPSLLQPGKNVLAVEVHQWALDSMDLKWEAELLEF